MDQSSVKWLCGKNTSHSIPSLYLLLVLLVCVCGGGALIEFVMPMLVVFLELLEPWETICSDIS